MKQGDIVIVPFPYTDLSALKNRPAMVVSKNNNGEDVILMAVSSKNVADGFRIDNNSLGDGCLPVTSFVKIRNIVTVKKSIVRRRVAGLKNNVCREVVEKFKKLF